MSKTEREIELEDAIFDIRDEVGPLLDDLNDLLVDHDEACMWRCFDGAAPHSHSCDHAAHKGD